MEFKNFEHLVNYAVSGRMCRGEVSAVVSKLKTEKVSILKHIASMPECQERRESFERLHDLMYRLYDARVCVAKDVYVSVSIMANMVLCYHCH